MERQAEHVFKYTHVRVLLRAFIYRGLVLIGMTLQLYGAAVLLPDLHFLLTVYSALYVVSLNFPVCA